MASIRPFVGDACPPASRRAIARLLLQVMSDMKSARMAFGRVALADALMHAACLADCLGAASDRNSARRLRSCTSAGASCADLEAGSARDRAHIIREYGVPNTPHDVAEKLSTVRSRAPAKAARQLKK